MKSIQHGTIVKAAIECAKESSEKMLGILEFERNFEGKLDSLYLSHIVVHQDERSNEPFYKLDKAQ